MNQGANLEQGRRRRIGRLALAALMIGLSPAQQLGHGIAVVPVEELRPQVPVFHSATAETRVTAGEGGVDGVIDLRFRVIQGRPERLSVGLDGEGEVVAVEGGALAGWELRRGSDGSRRLEILPLIGEGPLPGQLEYRVRTREQAGEAAFNLTIPGPGGNVGFSSRITIEEPGGQRLRVLAVSGLSAVEGGRVFRGVGEASLRVRLESKGARPAAVELLDPVLVGELDDEWASFVLRGALAVREEDSALTLFEGAALSGATEGGGWHARVSEHDGRWVTELVGESAGDAPVPVELRFEVPVVERDGWRRIDFRLPAGVIVPVRLFGPDAAAEFDRAAALVPEREDDGWGGYLNALGEARFGWRTGATAEAGALFYESEERAELRVGAGLLRQTSEIDLRVLQGSLDGLELRLEGPGEVLAVRGPGVYGWSLAEDADGRRLRVELNRPVEDAGRLTIEAQSAIGAFPVTAEPLRFRPLGALRHSGHVRIANEGAVRLELVDVQGMMQLSPGQFPGGPAEEGLRQLFVYRFPSADYSYAIAADQVLPEVWVSEVTVHEMGETDRAILSSLELEIREAPLREWSLEVPADFAVAAVAGAKVADYQLSGEVVDGRRTLRVLFREALIGRHLVQLRLERNLAAAAGAWSLPKLAFPGVKTQRGFVGVSSARGFRVAAEAVEGLAELPVDYFPQQVEGLQLAFRLREPGWSAALRVEALGRSVQADVFHLYALKEGVAYGSVVCNFFVVGAPASEWRIAVPEGVGNLRVTGQDVGRDWRLEDGVLVVPLARPALGPATVLVTFEEPMSARGGRLAPGSLRPLEVQSERGYIQVTSPLQVDASVLRGEGSLLRIDASELPLEYRLLSDAPTLAAWQYTAGDPDIAMEINWFRPGETTAEVLEFAALESHVSRDGEVVTRARMFVRHRRGSTLSLRLPEGTELWEVRVAGEPVNARVSDSGTLIPLGAEPAGGAPVEVELRYGVAGGGRTLTLTAPAVEAPVAIASWTVSGDADRRLVPVGGSAGLLRPVDRGTGFEFLTGPAGVRVLWVLLLAALGVVLHRFRPLTLLACLAVFGAVAWSLGLAREAELARDPGSAVLEYASAALVDGTPATIELRNATPASAMLSVPGLLLAVPGIALLAWGAFGAGSYRRLVSASGCFLVALALLAQRDGALAFLVAVALALTGLGLRWVLTAWRGRVSLRTAAAVLVGLLALASGLRAEPAAERIEQRWSLSDGRLHGDMRIRVRAEEGGQGFPLLRAPAVLHSFEGEGLRVVKEGGDYRLVSEAPGVAEGRARFELPVPDPEEGWEVPSGVAASQRIVFVSGDDPRELRAEPAASVVAGDAATEIVLLPGSGARVRLLPPRRDPGEEATRFFTEVADLYVPGPGVVNGRHRVTVRPARGVVRELRIEVPAPFSVGEVEGPVATWRFNPEERELRIALASPQAGEFALRVDTQAASGGLPATLELAPLRVREASGAVGLLALAFGPEAQAESVEVRGMGEVNLEDFDAALLPQDSADGARPVLQQAFRYGEGEAGLSLRVAAVAPELRAESRQTLSLGSDRMVLAVDLRVNITRSGVFRLVLDLPQGLEVESLGGAALSHWTEGGSDGEARTLTLHLQGRTLGEQAFTLSLAGPAPGARDGWSVPRVALREATRERGQLTVVPERGLQIRAVDRQNVSQIDPDELGVPRPGALAFRLLQSDWSLDLAIRELDPWVTAEVLHRVTLREGQVLHRARLGFRIENAARKTLQVRIPGLDEAARATVRASGPAVGDLVPVVGEPEVWEVRLQRGIVGETPVELEFQSQHAAGPVRIRPVELPDVRQVSYFVAVDAGGRLEASLAEVPRGWQRADWSALPAALRDESGAGRFLFRAAEVEGDLVVAVARHELADALRLRVREGRLSTLVSADGSSVTAVVMDVELREKGSLRLRLPDGAELFHVLVNGQGVPLVRDEEDWLFPVDPPPLGEGAAALRFAYGLPGSGAVRLEGPRMDVPLEGLSWEVFLPPGRRLARSHGDFELVESEALGGVDVDAYRQVLGQRQQLSRQEAVAELDRGYELLAAGDQAKAGEMLERAARNGVLDEASNEDARVQFRNLKLQQAVLGLNTRRQRNYLDNRFQEQGDENALLEQAARENPILRGDANFDPGSFDRLMFGNSAEETSALKEIAGCIVEQQLEVQPAPETLDFSLPRQGRRLLFTRSLQVDGLAPMELGLELVPERRAGVVYGSVVAALVVAVLGVGWRKVPRG